MLRRGPRSYVYMISSPGLSGLGVGTAEEEEKKEEEEEKAGGDSSSALAESVSGLRAPRLSLPALLALL